MQTEADLPPVTDLPTEECSSVTGVTLVEEAMTVKEGDEEDQQVLCDSPVLPPAEASLGTEPETSLQQEAAEEISDDFSPVTQQSPTSVMSPPAICSPQGQEEQERQQHKTERGRGRGRRRSRWKLKFHHQALPPEYLDHYEASMAQQEANKAAALKSESRTNSSVKSGQPLGGRNTGDKNPNKQNTEKSGGRASSEKSGGATSEKTSKSPVQCIPIKIESDSQTVQFTSTIQPQTSLILNAGGTPVEQLRLIPLQTLGIPGSDNDIMTRLQTDFQRHNMDDEVSIINEKKSVTNGDKCIQHGKGLLGCLLTGNQQSESGGGNKNVPVSDNGKRRSSVIMSSSSTSCSNSRSATPLTSQHNTSPTTSKVMKYQDLPYMGEITLDNMKPRRGRKPKKADICHLIYKNYGTIFPGAPNSSSLAETEEQNSSKRRAQQENVQQMKVKSDGTSISSGIKCRTIESLRGGSAPINHADVQNRIISSLLEKRLTAASQQEANRKHFFSTLQDFNFGGAWNKRTVPVPPVSPAPSPSVPPPPTCSDEPLNLCVKDLNQLKIRLLRKHGNFYEPRSSTSTTNNTNIAIASKSGPSPISVKSEPTNNSSSSDMEELLEICDDSPKFAGSPDDSRNHTPIQTIGPNDTFPQAIAGLTFPSPSEFQPPGTTLPGGYVYWPGAGVFVHPMALQSQLLYYQKMGAIPLVSMSPTEQSLSGQTFIPTAPLSIPHLAPTPTTSLTPQVNTTKSSGSQSKPEQKQATTSVNAKNAIPKAFSSMINAPGSGKPCGVMPSELTFPRMKRLAPLGIPPPTAGGTGAKRKRSAIFIPPMPSENNSNPTTEVSICKFKFTGGAKPSLQEKKMLSVDSGGNFRYYSGTGDKSMRGYEFFPRESLQQSAGASAGSPSEHFLAAASSAMTGNDKLSMSNTLLRDSLPTGFPLEEHRKYLSGTSTSDVKCIGSSATCDINQPSLPSEVDSSKNSLDGRGIYFDQQGIKKKCENSDRLDCESIESGDQSQFESGSQHFRLQRRKRKTRKSLAREKLEQTFKEKGFLIQTQQLESAEGATYCKFRQLRKFTRYLFRSWKDYLPGNVREMSVAAGVSAPGEGSPPPPGDSELEGELSSSPPTPTSSTQTTLIDDSPHQPPST